MHWYSRPDFGCLALADVKCLSPSLLKCTGYSVEKSIVLLVGRAISADVRHASFHV